MKPPPDKKIDLNEAGTLLPGSPANKGDAVTSPVSRSESQVTQGTAQFSPEAARTFDFLAPPQAAGELGRLGNYRILKVLGQGGMGIVFLAEDVHLQRTVALKAMLPGAAQRPAARERFLREARAAATLEHDHIVTVHQVGEDRGVPYMAMPLLKGLSLDEYLCQREQKQPGPALKVNQILKVGREIAKGLAAAHQRGLIHRDIKPANIWLDATAGGRVKILDFGLARATTGGSTLTQLGTILGTPAYMAPEQAQGGKVDARADLFSLGVVLYRLCTGDLPFRGPDTMSTLMALITTEPPPPRTLQADIPQELSDLVMHLLAKDPARRPAAAPEVVQAILKIEKDLKASGGQPPVAIPVLVALPALESAPGGRKRKRWLLVGSAVLVLGLLGYFLVALLGRGDQGTLIVEVDDPKVKVVIKHQDAVVRDQTTRREFTLQAGPGVVEVFDTDGVGPLLTTQFTLERGGKATVKVRMKQARFGRPQLTLDPGGHRHFIGKVRFTPDGKHLLTGAGDGLRIWDVATGKTVRVLHPPGHFLGHFALAADGRKLAVICRYPEGEKPTHVIYVLTFPDGRIKHVLKGHTDSIRSVAFSANGQRLASGGDDKTIRIWELDQGKAIQVIPAAGLVIGLAFAPDGKRLAQVVSDSYFCTIMEVNTGKAVVRLNAGKVNAWTSQEPVAWSADGTTVATCGPDGFRLWKPDGTLHRHLLPKVLTGSVAFSADSRRVLATWRYGDHRAAVFDVGSGTQGAMFMPPKPPRRSPKNGNGGVFSPDGKLAATVAGAEGIRAIFLWDPANGVLVKRLAAPTWLPWPESQAGWSADGKTVSWRKVDKPSPRKGPRKRPNAPRPPAKPKVPNAGPWKGGPTTFHLGALRLGPPLASAQQHGAVQQRGPLFLKPVNAKTVQVVKNGETISDLTLPGKHQRRDPFTLVGKGRAALNSGSSLVFVFDTDTGKLIRELGHGGTVWSIAPSPDGRYLLSLSEDQILRIFYPNREQALLLLLYVSGPEWILWTPEGYYAASPGGERLLGWTVHHGIDKETSSYPAEHFRKQFYRPDVIQRVLEKGSVNEALAAANAALKKG